MMIAMEPILISGRPGSNEDQSGNHFAKTITIAGNPKSIFAKTKNIFSKGKNQNVLSGNRSLNLNNTFFFSKNRSAGNILQEAGTKLKDQRIILSESGNILKEEEFFFIFSAKKLMEDKVGPQEAGKKSKEDESGLKNLGRGMFFVETSRNFEIHVVNFLE